MNKLKICPHCHWGQLYRHPENKDYTKCATCGFCQLDIQEINELWKILKR